MNQIEMPAARSDLLRYAPHIDGLRAIAIIAVVGNHIGLPGFSGGYVGVDIFFVISGFLIITQIVDDLNRGAFSFADFWARRALRILPPLVLVLLASVAIGSYVSVTPIEFFMLGQEALYSALMAINFLLLAQQGYFDALAVTKPFLHLWSLAVEEQFYLAAPVVLTAAIPVFRRWPSMVGLAATAAFIASLGACIVYSLSSNNLAFYMMPMRIWEFMLGGGVGLAVPYLGRLPKTAIEALGGCGLLVMLATIYGYGPDGTYPSYLAILPALGAAIVIGGGLASPFSRFVGLLSLRPVVAIGLASYAWYLWHWPLIAFARQYEFGALPLWLGGVAAAVSLVLAWLTHLYVEVPIRKWRRPQSRRTWKTASAGAVGMVIVGLCLTGICQHLASTRPPGPGLVTMSGPCRLEIMSSPNDCLATAKGRAFGFLSGDSHAIAASPTIQQLASAHSTGLVTLAQPGCLPLLSVVPFSGAQKAGSCEEGDKRALQIISARQFPIRYAVMVARWQIYAGDGPTLDRLPRHLIGPIESALPAVDQRRAFVEGVRSQFAALQEYGVQKILVIAPTPDFSDAPGDCVARAIRQHADVEAKCSQPRSDFEAERSTAMEWLGEAVAGSGASVRLIDPIDAFCDPLACHMGARSVSLYADGNHLDAEGEAALIKHFQSDFDWVASP